MFGNCTVRKKSAQMAAVNYGKGRIKIFFLCAKNKCVRLSTLIRCVQQKKNQKTNTILRIGIRCKNDVNGYTA